MLGPVGLLVGEEATVRDALNSLIRHIRLHKEALNLRVEEHDGSAIFAVPPGVKPGHDIGETLFG